MQSLLKQAVLAHMHNYSNMKDCPVIPDLLGQALGI